MEKLVPLRDVGIVLYDQVHLVQVYEGGVNRLFAREDHPIVVWINLFYDNFFTLSIDIACDLEVAECCVDLINSCIQARNIVYTLYSIFTSDLK